MFTPKSSWIQWNDPYIEPTTYPNMPEYRGCLTSQAVSVFQIDKDLPGQMTHLFVHLKNDLWFMNYWSAI